MSRTGPDPTTTDGGPTAAVGGTGGVPVNPRRSRTRSRTPNDEDQLLAGHRAPDPKTVLAARRTAARHATGPDDLRRLLGMLGIGGVR